MRRFWEDSERTYINSIVKNVWKLNASFRVILRTKIALMVLYLWQNMWRDWGVRALAPVCDDSKILHTLIKILESEAHKEFYWVNDICLQESLKSLRNIAKKPFSYIEQSYLMFCLILIVFTFSVSVFFFYYQK